VLIPRPPPGHAKLWVLGTLGILLGCALAVWFGLASTLGKATAQDLGYRIVDDRAVDVTYRVSRPAGRDVTCVIRAMDRGFGTVGQIEVHIPGSDQASVQRTTRVRTTARAVTGVVRSCSVN
jgi:hypothetical protein